MTIKLAGLLQSLGPAVPMALTVALQVTPGVSSVNVFRAAVVCTVTTAPPGVEGVNCQV